MNDSPTIAVWTSGGPSVGFGHVRRCLSLAEALRRNGAKVVFLLGGGPAVCDLVRGSQFDAFPVHMDRPHDIGVLAAGLEASVIILDSYQITTNDMETLSSAGFSLVVIDDLADRHLPVTLVVNGSVGAHELPYTGASGTTFLLGPQYALLRSEFSEPFQRETSSTIGRVLITLGGSDPKHMTWPIVNMVHECVPRAQLDVVVGPFFERAEAQLPSTAVSQTVLHVNPPELRSLMLACGIAISGGGQTCYELAATATPTIAVRVAENQTANLRALSSQGCLLWIGDADDNQLSGRLRSAIATLSSADSRQRLGAQGPLLIDGLGSKRVSDAILRIIGTLSEAEAANPQSSH